MIHQFSKLQFNTHLVSLPTDTIDILSSIPVELTEVTSTSISRVAHVIHKDNFDLTETHRELKDEQSQTNDVT